MNLLRFFLLLQLTTTTALGQAAGNSKPAGLPKQPEALVRSLYTEVVARHPIGIPREADIKTFAPYLSKALLHRIDLAGACYDDWLRQNLPSDQLKAPFGWPENGLFSGGDERASPHTFDIERSQPERNGATRVYVKLTRGLRENPIIWHVAAIVVRENGHFVLDDVIYFKEYPEDIESRLSETLASGCHGPRWVGNGEKRNDVKQQM